MAFSPLWGTLPPVSYIIQEQDEPELNSVLDAARGILRPWGTTRVLTLGGLGVSFSGVSNSGSMGEHQISHYIGASLEIVSWNSSWTTSGSGVANDGKTSN